MHRLTAIFAVVTTGSGLVGLSSNVHLGAPTAYEVDAECSEIIHLANMTLNRPDS
jgi:hypothetical protein